MNSGQHINKFQMRKFNFKNLMEWLPVVASLLFSLIAISLIIFNDGLNFIHPHRFDNHLDMLLTSRHFEFGEFLNIFKEFAPGEYRPRFLTYALILADLRVRMFWYSHVGVLLPTFSWCWFLYFPASMLLIYKIIYLDTKDSFCAFCTCSVYISSVGFLSGFSMYFTPGKPLSNIIFLVIIYVMLKARQKYNDAELYCNIELKYRFTIFSVLLLGLFLDEMPIFGFIIPLILFPEFFYKKKWSGSNAESFIQLSFPLITFLALVIFIAPKVTLSLFNYEFDYLGSLFARGASSAGAKSLTEGPYGKFGLYNFFVNYSTLLGISFVPWEIAPFTKDTSAGGVISSQSNGLGKLIYLIIIFLIFYKLKIFKKIISLFSYRPLTRSVILATGFIVFISALSGRHVPFITSYYYGCAWAVFFSYAYGLMLYQFFDKKVMSKFCIGLITLIVVCIQLNNFFPINSSYISIHNEGMVVATYKEHLPIAPLKPTTNLELKEIYEAWSSDKLSIYLQNHQVSSGSVFLIKELEWIKNKY